MEKKGLRFSYPFDLQVSEGEAFGFIDPNGAGKTTTIKMLTGLQKFSSGKGVYAIKFDQKDPKQKSRL